MPYQWTSMGPIRSAMGSGVKFNTYLAVYPRRRRNRLPARGCLYWPPHGAPDSHRSLPARRVPRARPCRDWRAHPMSEFNWWLLILGLVIGAGLVWLILADSQRRESEISEAELPAEAAWIAATLGEPGDAVDAEPAEPVLRLHRAGPA